MKNAAAFVAVLAAIAAQANCAERGWTIEPLETMLARRQGVTEEYKADVRRNVAAIQRGEPIVKAGAVPGLDIKLLAPPTTLSGWVYAAPPRQG